MKKLLLLLIPFIGFSNFEIVPNPVYSSDITSTGVSVSATMNSDGSLGGSIYLWYGEGNSLSSFQSVGINVWEGVTMNGVTVNGSLSDLNPSTQYVFRWAVANSSGSIIYYSNETSFITGSNSEPTNIILSSTEISENAQIGSIVGSLSTLDPDSGDEFTYSLVSGDGDSGNSNFSINGSNLLSASTFDAETTPNYSVRIQTNDGNGGVFSKSFTISITSGGGSDNSLPSYVPTNGLMAFYPFNGTADDASVNSNNGSVNGSILSNDRNGNPDSSYYFDGQDDYMNMGSDESLKIQNSFSSSVWFKAMGGSCNPRIFEYYNNAYPGGGYGLALTTGTQLHVAQFGARNEEHGFAHIDNVFSQNTWTHIAFTVEGSTGQAKLYVNGELFLNQPIIKVQTQQINYGGSLHLGNIDPSRCDWFRGYIDDLGLWNRILSEEEVAQLFDQTLEAESLTYSFNAYPNPTSSTIEVQQEFSVAKVYSITGQELLKSNSKTIDLSELPSSVYLLRLYDNSNKVLGTTKVVKQ